MPVQNIGNDIIKAYLSGVKARQAALNASEHVRQIDEGHKEAIRQFDATQKQQEEHFTANLALQKAIKDINVLHLKANLQEHIAKTGLVPPGTSSEQLPTSTSEQDQNSLNNNTSSVPRTFLPTGESFGGNNQLRNPDAQGPGFTNRVKLPENMGTFDAPDPLTYARQQAGVSSILQQPKIQAAIDTAKGLSPIKVKTAADIENATVPGKMQLITAAEEAKTREAASLQKDKMAQLQENIKSRKEVAQINAASRLAAAKIHGANSGIDPNDVGNISTLVAAGQQALPTDAKTRNAVLSVLKNQDLVAPTKQVQDKIEGLGSLPTIFNQMRDFANKNLSETKGFGPFATAFRSGISQSEIKNELDSINISSGPVARIIEGLTGRQTMQQMNLAKDAMTSGKITKGEALKKIISLENLAFSKLKNELLGGMSDKQKGLILESHPELQKIIKVFTDKSTGKPFTAITHDNGLTYERAE